MSLEIEKVMGLLIARKIALKLDKTTNQSDVWYVCEVYEYFVGMKPGAATPLQ